MSDFEETQRHLAEWKEEKEVSPSVSNVERALAEVYDGLGSPTTSSLTPEERQLAERTSSSYLFGEVLPAGVSRMLDDDHLDAASARVLFDLGMGCGRLCMQAFLQYPNLREVVGVELSSSRAGVGMEALDRLYELRYDSTSKRVSWQMEMADRPPSTTITVTSNKQTKRAKMDAEQRRVISFRECNLFDVPDAARADIVVLETNILQARWPDLASLLSSLKPGSRLLTYNRLEEIYSSLRHQTPDHAPSAAPIPCPWRKLPDPYGEDHYAASWGNARFHVYRKVA